MTSKSMADLFLESTKPRETKKHYVNAIKAFHYLCSFWHHHIHQRTFYYVYYQLELNDYICPYY